MQYEWSKYELSETDDGFSAISINIYSVPLASDCAMPSRIEVHINRDSMQSVMYRQKILHGSFKSLCLFAIAVV